MRRLHARRDPETGAGGRAPRHRPAALMRHACDAAVPGARLAPRLLSEHLAPRILDLVRRDGEDTKVERAFARGGSGDRQIRRGAQCPLLDAFQDAHADTFASDAPRGVMLGDALCLFAKGRFAMAPIMERLDALPPAEPVGRLRHDRMAGPTSPRIWRTAY
jgi:hypothetical protein